MAFPRRGWSTTFLPAWVALTVAWCAIILRHSVEISITGSPVRESVWFLGACELLAYVWIRTRSTPLFRQIRAIVAILVCQALPIVVFQLDGFHGDGRAFLAWRWQTRRGPAARSTVAGPVGGSGLVSSRATGGWDATEDDSPGFRGADRTGVVHEAREWRDWTQPPHKRWQHSVGSGWSSFAVAGRYAVTQEQRGDAEAVVCYELDTGQECWLHSDPVQFHEWMGGAWSPRYPHHSSGSSLRIGCDRDP